LNRKEIVLSAINHQPVGLLPFDVFEGWMWPDIAARLMRRLGSPDHEEMLDRLGAYCRWVTARYIGPPLPPGAKDRVASPHTTHSLNASIWGLQPGLRMHGAGTAGHPLARAQSVQDILDYPWPSPDWFDYPGANQSAAAYGGHFVVFGGFSPIFYLIADLCGMEKALLDVIMNPELIHALVDRIVEFYTGYFSRVAVVCRGNVDAIAFGDDFSGQLNMLLSPAHWREYFKPAWSRLFSIVKGYGYKIMFHSCGSVYPVIPDLIEIGLDVLYPVQPLSRSMELGLLKERFGSELAFYGAIDVQGFLPWAGTEEIEQTVNRVAEMFRDGGGYVLSTSHVIMDDVPEQNVLALYKAASNVAQPAVANRLS
jgi:uroporphyrinogen decarboxylase